MYKATVENKLTGRIEEVQKLATPYETLCWLDYTIEEINYIDDIKVSSPLTVSAYLCMLQGQGINVRYKYEDEIYTLYLERIEDN